MRLGCRDGSCERTTSETGEKSRFMAGEGRARQERREMVSSVVVVHRVPSCNVSLQRADSRDCPRSFSPSLAADLAPASLVEPVDEADDNLLLELPFAPPPWRASADGRFLREDLGLVLRGSSGDGVGAGLSRSVAGLR